MTSLVSPRGSLWAAGLLCLLPLVPAPSDAQGGSPVRERYLKQEHMIPMRDGPRLFTSVYLPRDGSRSYPIMLLRTPYSVAPYGADAYRSSLGPSRLFQDEGFIFAYQDARGRYMSEGDFVNVRPHRRDKRTPAETDESSDTYDTIDWLVKNIPNNNGRVGMWGISYPGFYAAAGLPDSHPSLKAASPQAPIADWFIGDDFHHNGAFFLLDAFNFFAGFGRARPRPTTESAPGFRHTSEDNYRFFLELGPLSEADRKYFKGEIAFWNDLMRHGTYDAFWRARSLPPNLENVRCAVLTVGGWFDAEDLYGPLRIYAALERANPGIGNTLVMGPWSHGQWASGDGSRLGDIDFGARTSAQYQAEAEFPFFRTHLKGDGTTQQPEARVFNTGANRWRTFDCWPPHGRQPRAVEFGASGRLGIGGPRSAAADGFDEYVSDPAKPVPYTGEVRMSRGGDYMIEDQRFAARRPDVLVYQSEPLTRPLTLAGPIEARLFISTTGRDADFVVKLIDVLPEGTPPPNPNPGGARMGGYQMLVRAEVMRAKFRDSFERPAALLPGQVTPVNFTLPDVLHTFQPGHRLMVQVQSSWFPLVDRNPQRFVDIYRARPADFRKASHRIFRTARHRSRLRVGVLEE